MAGRRARPGRGVGDKGEPENNPSLVQPPESRAGWPSPISRQLTRAPAHSQPLQLDPTPLRADWPEEARALARMQPGWCRAPPSDQAAPRLQGSRLSQELRVALPQAGQRNPNPYNMNSPKPLLTVLRCLSAPGAGQNPEQMHLVNVGSTSRGSPSFSTPQTHLRCQSLWRDGVEYSEAGFKVHPHVSTEEVSP